MTKNWKESTPASKQRNIKRCNPPPFFFYFFSSSSFTTTTIIFFINFFFFFFFFIFPSSSSTTTIIMIIINLFFFFFIIKITIDLPCGAYNSPEPSIVDSGTTVISVPLAVHAALVAKIPLNVVLNGTLDQQTTQAFFQGRMCVNFTDAQVTRCISNNAKHSPAFSCRLTPCHWSPSGKSRKKKEERDDTERHERWPNDKEHLNVGPILLSFFHTFSLFL